MVSIAPDSSWLATADDGDDGTVRVWNPVTGQQTATLTGHTGKVIVVTIAPHGNWVATVDEYGEIRIWDRRSKHVLAMMRTDAVPVSCTWMPDSSGVVMSSEHGVYFYEFHLDASSA